MNNLKKAEQFFRKVISNYPGNPLVPLCWLGLGQAQLKREAYTDAVQASRSALSFPLDKDKSAAANYVLGKSLEKLDVYKEALDAFHQSQAQDPQLYLQHVDLLRSLGETYFATKQFDKSHDYLLWYMNLAREEIPDKDMLMAKVAESLLHQGEEDLSKKVYGYVERNYPESEGHIVSKIRRAEIFEKQENSLKHKAAAIYQDLSQKSLPESVSKLVYFKLARWEWQQGNYDKSALLTDDAMRIKASSVSDQELVRLKERILSDWLNREWKEKRYDICLGLVDEATRIKDKTTPDEELLRQKKDILFDWIQHEWQEGRPEKSLALIDETLRAANASLPANELLKLKEKILFDWLKREWQEGRHDKSLALMDDAMSIKAGGIAPEELTRTKEQILVDWAKQSYDKKDYGKVVEIYEKHQPAFKALGLHEVEAMVAESYAAQKLYPKAADLYQQLMARSGRKNDDWLLRMAQFEYLKGDLDKATQNLLKIEAENLVATRDEMLGKIYYSRKAYREASQRFAGLFKEPLKPEQIGQEHFNSYIDSLFQLGRFGDTLQALEAALKVVSAEDGEKRLQLGLMKSRCYEGLKQQDKAIGVLEEIIPLIKADDLKDQMNYRLAELYLGTNQQDKAMEKLAVLLGSSQPLWRMAAQQQIDFLNMQKSSKTGQ